MPQETGSQPHTHHNENSQYLGFDETSLLAVYTTSESWEDPTKPTRIPPQREVAAVQQIRLGFITVCQAIPPAMQKWLDLPKRAEPWSPVLVQTQPTNPQEAELPIGVSRAMSVRTLLSRTTGIHTLLEGPMGIGRPQR
ncbi:uncharacterized protein FFC1_09264 [Fusarium fujikuroi]|nr:uncharacterized protein FFC1_09264 [Fusarium fujikuroi]